MLLLRYDDPPPLGTHWVTPGGGIEPGESARDAAARELREETGWVDVQVGEELGRSTRPIRTCVQHETHFLARVDVPRRPVGEDGHAADEIAGWAWFDALPADPVWPVELPAYLERVRGATLGG